MEHFLIYSRDDGKYDHGNIREDIHILSTATWLWDFPNVKRDVDQLILSAYLKWIKHYGICLVSSEAKRRFVPVEPLFKQAASKYLTGSRAMYSVYDMGRTRYTTCQNCGAVCQGVVNNDECDMCEGEEGVLFKCDCWEEGGIEDPKMCAIHGQYVGVETAERSIYDGFDANEGRKYIEWSTQKQSRSSWTVESERQSLLRTEQQQEQAILDSFNNSSKVTSGSFTFSQLFNPQGIGERSTRSEFDPNVRQHLSMLIDSIYLWVLDRVAKWLGPET